MDVDRYRELFPVCRSFNFQNHAGVAPLSLPAVDAIGRYARLAAETAGVSESLYEPVERIRAGAAKLIGSHSDEITFVKNTTEGLGWVAGGLDWRVGDNVVSTAVEFPANVYPWMALVSRGVQLRQVAEEAGRIPLDRLIEAIDENTRVLAVSAVQYASGFRMDLQRLGQLCRERDILFCVDAIQSLGVLPIDVEAMAIDFLSADGHKWLCGPEGCGIFYCRRERLPLLTPVMTGWLCMVDAMNFGDYRFEYVQSARKFDTGSYNLAGIYAMGASLEMFLELGIEAIWQRVKQLTDHLVQRLEAKGYRVISSRRQGEASGIVAFVSDRHDQADLQHRLQHEHGVVIALREGRLRASPHFYNTIAEIDQLADLLPEH